MQICKHLIIFINKKIYKKLDLSTVSFFKEHGEFFVNIIEVKYFLFFHNYKKQKKCQILRPDKCFFKVSFKKL